MRRLPTVISLDATPANFDSVGAAYGHRPAGNGILDRQKYRLNRAALQAAAALVAWSDWARDSLVTDYGVPAERIHVIAPGAGAAFFEIGSRRVQATPRPRAANEPVKLLFVGGDFQRKGGPLLLECMRGPLGERCELHVVTREEVLAQRNVHVHRGLGPNSPALLALFQQADIFVLPTFAECLAVVLMEAAAAGLPVITSDVGALREAIIPGETGTLVPAGDGAALAHAIRALAEDRPQRERMGRAAHQLARWKFDARRNGRLLLGLVAEASQSRRSSGVAA